MKKWKIVPFIALAIVLIFIFNIKNSETTKTNVINIYRFEQSLFATNESKIDKDILEWEKRLGAFFESFNYEILRTNSKQENYKQELLQFISHPDMREAFDTLIKKYPNVNFLETELSEAFDRYNQYFPQKVLPKVVTYFSGFNFGVVTNDTILAIGLDYFLGKDCSFYKRLNSPKYMRLKNQSKFILPFCFEAIANNEFSDFNSENNFLSQMIYKGKIMYFLDVILPQFSNADKLRFSQDQLNWCKENESNIWAYFIDNEILYSTDIKKINSYINYAPFAKGMPKESPGRIAYWMGWNIVKTYMNNKKNITIEQLMENTNPQEILQQSRYKP
tara:strand:- start:224 stop:1222 length:999 start_codon:yes stop_codon:yes gene_type:complete